VIHNYNILIEEHMLLLIYNFVRSDIHWNLYACRYEGICNTIVRAILLIQKEKHKVNVL